MEYVEPIRSKKKIEALCHYLKSKSYRDYVLFLVGINSCLRISDLLSLTVADVKDKDRISIREKKTGKYKDFPINDICKKVLHGYTKDMHPESLPLFPSQKGGSISRVHAYRVLNEAAQAVGIQDKIGTHTLRKTFAYWVYKDCGDIALLQKLLNHDSPGTTLRYIGVTRDDMDSLYFKLNLGI